MPPLKPNPIIQFPIHRLRKLRPIPHKQATNSNKHPRGHNKRHLQCRNLLNKHERFSKLPIIHRTILLHPPAK